VHPPAVISVSRQKMVRMSGQPKALAGPRRHWKVMPIHRGKRARRALPKGEGPSRERRAGSAVRGGGRESNHGADRTGRADCVGTRRRDGGDTWVAHMPPIGCDSAREDIQGLLKRRCCRRPQRRAGKEGARQRGCGKPNAGRGSRQASNGAWLERQGRGPQGVDEPGAVGKAEERDHRQPGAATEGGKACAETGMVRAGSRHRGPDE